MERSVSWGPFSKEPGPFRTLRWHRSGKFSQSFASCLLDHSIFTLRKYEAHRSRSTCGRHYRVSHIRTVLLYGHPMTGKTMLSRAIAYEAGANFFDLSPKNTDGKYSGKQVSLLIHMVVDAAPMRSAEGTRYRSSKWQRSWLLLSSTSTSAKKQDRPTVEQRTSADSCLLGLHHGQEEIEGVWWSRRRQSHQKRSPQRSTHLPGLPI